MTTLSLQARTIPQEFTFRGVTNKQNLPPSPLETLPQKDNEAYFNSLEFKGFAVQVKDLWQKDLPSKALLLTSATNPVIPLLIMLGLMSAQDQTTQKQSGDIFVSSTKNKAEKKPLHQTIQSIKETWNTSSTGKLAILGALTNPVLYPVALPLLCGYLVSDYLSRKH